MPTERELKALCISPFHEVALAVARSLLPALGADDATTAKLLAETAATPWAAEPFASAFVAERFAGAPARADDDDGTVLHGPVPPVARHAEHQRAVRVLGRGEVAVGGA